MSQSLFQWKLLCNTNAVTYIVTNVWSQSLFQWKLLCNSKERGTPIEALDVTILILVETPLQYYMVFGTCYGVSRHNPYFSGNSFAILPASPFAYSIIQSQSLFQWKLLCNKMKPINYENESGSQSLFQWKLLCNIVY